jgi:hypothetical protein
LKTKIRKTKARNKKINLQLNNKIKIHKTSLKKIIQKEIITSYLDNHDSNQQNTDQIAALDNTDLCSFLVISVVVFLDIDYWLDFENSSLCWDWMLCRMD